VAHTIPIGVWTIPTNAYKIFVGYLHQGRYFNDIVRVLTNRISKLEKLKETRLDAMENTRE
jgi:hypothetical protein